MHNVYVPQVYNRKIPVGIEMGWYRLADTVINNINASGIQYHNAGDTMWFDYQNVINICDSEKLNETAAVLDRVHPDSMLTLNGMPDWVDTVPVETMLYHLYRWADIVAEIPLCALQVWNEVDSEEGMENIYGLWGLPKLDLYLQILEVLQPIRQKVPLAVGLMGIPEWIEEFGNRGGFSLVDQVNYHYYGWWWPDIALDELWAGIFGLDSKIRQVRKKTSIPIHLTETNLITHYDPCDEFELDKAWYIREIYNRAGYLSLNSVWGFSYYTSWCGASFFTKEGEPLPAWETLKGLV